IHSTHRPFPRVCVLPSCGEILLRSHLSLSRWSSLQVSVVGRQANNSWHGRASASFHFLGRHATRLLHEDAH
ncbi:hypothetical protein PMAYCL1PPCAC_01263, partial [Pristionchus mayeri]